MSPMALLMTKGLKEKRKPTKKEIMKKVFIIKSSTLSNVPSKNRRL
jgi:hypothetical protein